MYSSSSNWWSSDRGSGIDYCSNCHCDSSSVKESQRTLLQWTTEEVCDIIICCESCDKYTSPVQRSVDITAKSNEAYGLTKISEEPTYMSVYQWFNVWKHGQPLHVLSCLIVQ